MIACVLVNTCYSQVRKIIVTSILHKDRTFHKRKELFLENRVIKNQITFTLDTVSQKITTRRFLIETYYSVWDGNTTIKKKIRHKYKKWKHEIITSEWDSILNALKTDIDTLKKNMTRLHTSHNYLNIYIDVISNNDTVDYTKTKPFIYLNPWFSKKLKRHILNPYIDAQIATHLPNTFIGRKELMVLLTKDSPPY